MSNSSCHETDHLHPVMKCAALGAIFHKVKDGHESLAEEVKCVIGMTADIDNAFEDVKGKLTKAELQTSVDGWVTLQKRFKELVLLSRKSASDIVYHIDSYNDVISLDTQANREDKQKMVMAFMENNDRGGFRGNLEGVSRHAIEFQNLARDVHTIEFPEPANEVDVDIKQIKIDLDANDGLFSHLWAFGIIWNSIAYEANKLLLYVDDVIEDISNYELTMDIKFCKEGCAVLKNALDDYVDLIDKSGIKA